MTRSPLAKVSRKRLAQRPARDACSNEVRRRAGGNCQLRIEGVCRGHGQHRHHVHTTGQGGPDVPENCLWACDPCNGWCESNTREAAALGLRKSGKWWFNVKRFAALLGGVNPPAWYGLEDRPEET